MHICLWSNGVWKNTYYGKIIAIFSSVSFNSVYSLVWFSNTKVFAQFKDFPTHVFLCLQSGPSGGLTKDMGINYLALNDLFRISNGRKDIISYDIHVQMVEIYNEQVRDLLAEDSSTVKYPFSRYCVGYFMSMHHLY